MAIMLTSLRSRLRLAEASKELVGENGSGRTLGSGTEEETFRWQASDSRSSKPSIFPSLLMAVIVLVYWLHSLLSITPFE